MRRIALATLAVAAALSTGACALWPSADPVVTAGPMPGQLEAIHAAAFTPDKAVFWVSSNGCTAKADLKPVVAQAGGRSTITLRRLTEDRCGDPVKDGVQVIWTFDELGLERGARPSVNNPYLLPQA